MEDESRRVPKKMDAYFIAVLIIIVGGVVAAAEGWILAWLGAALVLLGLVAVVGGIAYGSWKMGASVKEIVRGLGISFFFMTLLWLIGRLWVAFMGR